MAMRHVAKMRNKKEQAFARLVKRSLELALAADDALVACPTPDCPNRVWLVDGEDLPRLVCPLCRRESCVRCGAQPFHFGLSCEEQLRRSELGRAVVPRVRGKIRLVRRTVFSGGRAQCAVALHRWSVLGG